MVGPWDHLSSATGVYPDRQFGLAAYSLAADMTGLHRRFFDRWLRGQPDALDGLAPVRIFVMGIDQWRDEQDWPLSDTRQTYFFLSGPARRIPSTATAFYPPPHPAPRIGRPTSTTRAGRSPRSAGRQRRVAP